ncbi:MAG: hypothetical protein II741_05835, partial [Lachnospiraceae bacterium]|nr:hypothetical protein [Lachnospiraceae bacterium]
MKKKIVAALFSVALMASSLTGCGEISELVEDTGSEQTQEAIQEGLDTFSDALESLLDENEDVGEAETQNEESAEAAETQAEDAGSVSEGESAADAENT